VTVSAIEYARLPKCGHGAVFCTEEGDPKDPPCGCKPSMEQMVAITAIAFELPRE